MRLDGLQISPVGEGRHRQQDDVRVGDDGGVLGGRRELPHHLDVLSVGALLLAGHVDLPVLGGRSGRESRDGV